LIQIFDILGNEVAFLDSEYKPAGKYHVDIDASASGNRTYLYRLRGESFYKHRS